MLPGHLMQLKTAIACLDEKIRRFHSDSSGFWFCVHIDTPWLKQLPIHQTIILLIAGFLHWFSLAESRVEENRISSLTSGISSIRLSISKERESAGS